MKGYFEADVPCLVCNTTLRYNSTKKCVTCAAAARAKWREANPEKTFINIIKWADSGSGAACIKMRNLIKSNPDFYLPLLKSYRESHVQA